MALNGPCYFFVNTLSAIANHITLRRDNATFCQLHEMSTDGLIYIFLISIQKHYLKNQWFGFAGQIVMSSGI